MFLKIMELEIFGIMTKDEVLFILKEMDDNIGQMSDDELFIHLMNSSKTFREKMNKLEPLLYDNSSEKENIDLKDGNNEN